MFGLETEREMLAALGRAFRREADGAGLKRDLSKRLRAIVDPLKGEVVRRLMQIGSSGHEGESLRQAVAKQVRAGVRYSGRSTGVNLVQRTRGMPRDFDYAGRAMNRAEGWTPTNLGGVQVRQHARPAEWFDQPTSDQVEPARRAVLAAMEQTAERIARNARR